LVDSYMRALEAGLRNNSESWRRAWLLSQASVHCGAASRGSLRFVGRARAACTWMPSTSGPTGVASYVTMTGHAHRRSADQPGRDQTIHIGSQRGTYRTLPA